MLQLGLVPRPEKGLLLFSLTTPADVSISAKVGERRRVVAGILPVDLLDVLRRLNRKAEAVVEAHLCRLPQSSLAFVSRPIGRHKAGIEQELKRLDGGYAALRDRVTNRLDAVQAQAELFALEHGVKVLRRFDADWVSARFRLRWRWIPWMLSEGAIAELFGPEEQAEIRETLREDVAEAERDKARRLLQKLVQGVASAEGALAAGRVVNRRTLWTMSTYSEDLAAVAAGHEYAEAACRTRERVAALLATRDDYDVLADKRASKLAMQQGLHELSAAIERVAAINTEQASAKQAERLAA